MRRAKLFSLILLFIPVLVGELIDSKSFLIIIPGSPYSIGRLIFILIGISGLIKMNQNQIRFPRVSIALLLIFIGPLFGSFFSNDIILGISRALGNLILVLSAVGLGYLFKYERNTRVFYDLIFISNFTYWISYLLTNMFLGSGLQISYGELYVQDVVVNHHIIGINITTSVVYICNRFFRESKQFLFFVFYLIGVLSAFVVESRSNFILILFVFFLNIYFLPQKSKSSKFLLIIGIIAGITILINQFVSFNDDLNKRFDIYDNEYIESTNINRKSVYTKIPNLVIDNFFGNGPIDVMIEIESGEEILAHNSYLTFLISGGIISFIGLLLFFGNIIRLIKLFYFRVLSMKGYEIGVFLSVVLFLLTIFTIEYLGIYFFVYLATLSSFDNYSKRTN